MTIVPRTYTGSGAPPTLCHERLRGLRLRPDQKAALDELSRVTGLGASALLREALDLLINHVNRKEPSDV